MIEDVLVKDEVEVGFFEQYDFTVNENGEIYMRDDGCTRISHCSCDCDQCSCILDFK
ncbi:MAG: hypothetical protein K6A43_07500 [Treponema sp.]|nr:hypothetical protein [Treponema sp.]